MFAGEMVTLVFFSLIPLGIPILFEGLHIGVSLIQTYCAACLCLSRGGDGARALKESGRRQNQYAAGQQMISTSQLMEAGAGVE
jgi:hypothetical protein